MEDLPQLVRDIRARINAIDLPREQIAPRLNVTYSWLCKFMQKRNGSTNPRIGTLEKVLQGLDVIEGAHKRRLKKLDRAQASE